MSKERKGFPGLVPLARRLLYGAQDPKTRRRSEGATRTLSEAYDSMPEEEKWFRIDELVRKCVTINAHFATFTAGYETEIEAIPPEGAGEDFNPEPVLEKYAYVKTGIDELNKKLHMDKILFVSQIKRSIFGKVGWEIVMEEAGGLPAWLLALQSDKLKPTLNDTWELTGYKYTPKEGTPYKPEEVLYFVNLQLESDHLGLSDIEPLLSVCQARDDLLRKNFPEIVRTLWAPYVILQADTSLMADTEEDAFLDDLADKARAGKSIAINQAIEATVVRRDINMEGLVKLLDKFEESIHRQFGTPRFLVGKPIENRATAFAELESYIDGPIGSIQRYFRREMEIWYDRWARVIIDKGGEAKFPENEPMPFRIKHVWNVIRTADIYEMAKAVSVLWGNMGMGPIGGDKTKVYDMMGWPKDELGTLERKAADEHPDWTPRINDAEKERCAQLDVLFQSLQNRLVDLVNLTMGGTMSFENTLAAVAEAIKSYVHLAKENARHHAMNWLNVSIDALSPEEEAKFDQMADAWIEDFRKILVVAITDPDPTPLRQAAAQAIELTYVELRAAAGDYWETKEGVWARLQALAHDVQYRTFNGAIQVYASKAGFYSFEWVTQPSLSATGPCPICLGHDRKIYRRGQFMPEMPVHVNCVCIFRIQRKEQQGAFNVDKMVEAFEGKVIEAMVSRVILAVDQKIAEALEAF